MSIEYQVEVMEILIKHEQALGRLYRMFAEKLPPERDFWLEIATEEDTHAFLLTSLLNEVKAGKVKFEDNRFNRGLLNASLELINEKGSEIRKREITPKAALAIAIELERGMVDRKMFSIMANDNPGMKKCFAALSDQTEGHLARLNGKARP